MTALPRSVRGKRPAFHEQASIDRLIAMVLALTGEVSVLRERLRTVETLGERAGWLAPGAIDGFVPRQTDREAREGEREALLARVTHIMTAEISGLDGEKDYWADIAAIEEGQA